MTRARKPIPSSDQARPGRAIDSISPLRNKPDFVTIRVAGKKFGPISRDDAEGLGVVPGAAWSPELADQVAFSSLCVGAMNRALRLLAASSKSRKEVADRLSAAGFEHPVVDAVISNLVASGLLDDALFARNLASATRRPLAQRALADRLKRRGIDERTAEQTSKAAIDPLTERHAAARIAFDRASAMDPGIPAPKIARRVFDHLARRGFSQNDSRRAVETAMKRLGRPVALPESDE